MILGQPACVHAGADSAQRAEATHPGALDPDEPENVARMAAEMKLRYVVITSVNRDDLEDGGSTHFAATVRAVRAELPPEAQVTRW